jgi:hypothetical protein
MARCLAGLNSLLQGSVSVANGQLGMVVGLEAATAGTRNPGKQLVAGGDTPVMGSDVTEVDRHSSLLFSLADKGVGLRESVRLFIQRSSGSRIRLLDALALSKELGLRLALVSISFSQLMPSIHVNSMQISEGAHVVSLQCGIERKPTSPQQAGARPEPAASASE